MGLTDLKSNLDRNLKGIEGDPVGQNQPQDGDYYTNSGAQNSPFDSDDHLKDLLEDNIVSSPNSGLTYDPNQMIGLQPGPPQGDQDFDGVNNGQGIFTQGHLNGKQIGGVDLHEHLLQNSYTYTHGLNSTTTVGPAPGPSGHSDYQDLNLGDIRGNTPSTYKNNGPSDGFY